MLFMYVSTSSTLFVSNYNPLLDGSFPFRLATRAHVSTQRACRTFSGVQEERLACVVMIQKEQKVLFHIMFAFAVLDHFTRAVMVPGPYQRQDDSQRHAHSEKRSSDKQTFLLMIQFHPFCRTFPICRMVAHGIILHYFVTYFL